MAETLRGVRILLRLRLHHTKVRVTQLLYATGTDFGEDTSLMDRWYQLYVVLVLLVILVLTWAYLLDLAEGIGATLGVPGRQHPARSSVGATACRLRDVGRALPAHPVRPTHAS